MTDNRNNDVEMSTVRFHGTNLDGPAHIRHATENEIGNRRSHDEISAEEAAIIDETKRQMSNIGPLLTARPEDIPASYLINHNNETTVKYLHFPSPTIDYSELDRAPELYRDLLQPPRTLIEANESVQKILAMPDEQIKDFINQITLPLVPMLLRLGDLVNYSEKPATIAWRNLYYRKEGEMRLQGLSGFLRAGMMVCVLGAPDAGVTTLFEVLNGRAKGGKMSGELLLNGRPPDDSWDRIVGFCEKEDIHLPTLTVKETLYFSGRLKSPPEMKGQTVMHKVAIIMKLLGLSHVADSPVGDALIRGISGGERRRLSYGCELVAGHSIIIGDLITNGLDSASAYALIATAKRMTQSGRSLMCSLVQPSPDLLALFDCILLMSKGSQLYFGPPSHALPYLQSIGFIKPDKKSIPDFLEELSGHPERFYSAPIPASIPFVSLEGEKRLVKLRKQKLTNKLNVHIENKLSAVAATNHHVWQINDKLSMNENPSDESDYDFSDISHRSKVWLHARNSYKHSVFNHELGLIQWNLLETIPTFIREDGMNKTPLIGKAIRSTKQFMSGYHSSFALQMMMCFVRQYLITIRDKTLLISTFARAIVIGLLIGSLFYDLGDKQDDVRTRFGLLYFMLTFTATSQIAFVPTIMRDRAVYYLQTQSNYFHGSTYFMAFTALGVPIAAIESFLFVVVTYGLTGLQGGVGGEQFWYAYLVIWILNVLCRAWVSFICNVSPNQTIATALVPITLLIFGLFAGYLNTKSTIPIGWQWMYYLSLYTYGFRGLAQNEFLGLTFPPEAGKLYTFKNGHDALNLYDMDADEKWIMLRNLVFFWIGFSILAAFAMLYIDFAPRGIAAPPQWRDDGHTNKTNNEKDQGNIDENDEKSPSLSDISIPVVDDHAKELAAALRPRPVYLEWKNLDYIVDIGKGKKRTLLKQVYGYAEPGKMTALMGASGAGKSTLLDVLSGMKTGGEIRGDILVNGLGKDAKSWSSIAGYVEQSDSHNPTSTVREAILFSARLRLSASMSDAEKQLKVDQIIEILELTPFKDQQIGSAELGGLSPDIRKKVTIAVEMIMQPSILFLDEPSTGLESSGALSVMKTVRRLCQELGMSVLCTIHQPSAEIVSLFDDILLLKKGGEVAIFTPLDKVSDYCVDIGYSACPSDKNLADHVMDIIKDATMKFEDGASDAIDLAKRFREHAHGKKVIEALEKGITPPEIKKEAQSNPVSGAIRIGFIGQCKELLKRFFTSTIRNKPTFRVRNMVAIVVGLLFGSLFYQMGTGQKDATNRVALIFMSVLIPVFSAAMVFPDIFSMRPIYFRERQANMYSPIAYFLGRFISDIPFQFIESFLYSLIAYWMSGLTNEDGGKYFGSFLLAYFLIRMYGMGQAFTLGTISEGAEQANGLHVALSTIMMIFAGFLIVKDQIPNGWMWMYHLAVFHYPINYMASNEFKDIQFQCSSSEYIQIPTENGPQQICPIASGDQVLQMFGINPDDRSMSIGVVAAYVAFITLLSFITLKTVNHIKR